MSYKVYFGNYTIYGTESVEKGFARPVSVHNGLGAGEFPVPEDKRLRTLSLKGQWTEQNDYGLTGWEPAQEIIDGLQKMMDSDDPERIVMTNGYEKTSLEVLITDLNAVETSPGVYNFSMELTEHKNVTVKTTGVPTITRPGKVPVMPKTVTFSSAGDVAKYAMKEEEQAKAMQGPEEWKGPTTKYEWDTPYGKREYTYNPNLVPTGQPVTATKKDPYLTTEDFGIGVQAIPGFVESAGKWVVETRKAMQDGLDKWREYRDDVLSKGMK